jgi:dihydrolipoamide dehydrogenase
VGIVGVSAGDILTEAVVAIEMGATARDLAESIHPHPTLSETLGNAAETFLGSATEIYRPRPARKN